MYASPAQYRLFLVAVDWLQVSIVLQWCWLAAVVVPNAVAEGIADAGYGAGTLPTVAVISDSIAEYGQCCRPCRY